MAGESARHPVVQAVGTSELRHDDARQRIAIGVHHDEAMRDEVVAERVGHAGDARRVGLGVLDGEVIFGRVAAAHAFLADQQILDVDAGDVVGAGRELDGVARLHLRQRVDQRAAGMVVVVAVAGVRAGSGRHEARAQRIRMAVHDGRGQQHRAANASAGARNFKDSL